MLLSVHLTVRWCTPRDVIYLPLLADWQLDQLFLIVSTSYLIVSALMDFNQQYTRDDIFIFNSQPTKRKLAVMFLCAPGYIGRDNGELVPWFKCPHSPPYGIHSLAAEEDLLIRIQMKLWLLSCYSKLLAQFICFMFLSLVLWFRAI